MTPTATAAPIGPRRYKDLDPLVVQMAVDVIMGLHVYAKRERPDATPAQLLRALDVVYWEVLEGCIDNRIEL